MGLAPYGAPPSWTRCARSSVCAGDGSIRSILPIFRHHREPIAIMERRRPSSVICSPPALEAAPRAAAQADDPLEDRHRDIARLGSGHVRGGVLPSDRQAAARSGLTDLALAGGCAMNSVANGKVRRMTPFRRVYVQAAAGDAGGAIGAAFAVWHQLGGERSFVMDHAYWGPQFRAEVHDATSVERSGRDHRSRCTIETISDDAELCRRTAAAIADGNVVGWFQGRMEWGPRALGNRSIVCDPRRADMKATPQRQDQAPRVVSAVCAVRPRRGSRRLVRGGRRCTLHDAGVPDPSGKAAAHPCGHPCRRLGPVADGVRRTNSLYYRLIESFRDVTGVPMVLNTSFNENEPVVCEPRQALDCFLRTRMDMLVMGHAVLCRANVS